MSKAESKINVLDHIYFSDGRNMKELSNGSSQLVYLSPPYVGHHTIAERENEKLLNEELMKEAVRVTDPKFGFVVTYNTDFYLKGGIYPRHDVVREGAEKAGLELYATKYHISSLKRDQFRMTVHHIQVFIHSGELSNARKRNKGFLNTNRMCGILQKGSMLIVFEMQFLRKQQLYLLRILRKRAN